MVSLLPKPTPLRVCLITKDSPVEKSVLEVGARGLLQGSPWDLKSPDSLSPAAMDTSSVPSKSSQTAFAFPQGRRDGPTKTTAMTVAKRLDVGGLNGQSELVCGYNPLIMDVCGNHRRFTLGLIIRWSYKSFPT